MAGLYLQTGDDHRAAVLDGKPRSHRNLAIISRNHRCCADPIDGRGHIFNASPRAVYAGADRLYARTCRLYHRF